MRTLLLVEDTKVLAEGIADIFGMEEFVVSIANNGAEALELINGSIFDIVITDLVMPGMDGEVLIRELRKDQRYNNTPVIVLSAKSMDDAAQLQLKDQGADLVLNKSCEIELLLESVSNLIKGKAHG